VMRSKTIGLHDQNMLTILGSIISSIFDMTRDLYEHLLSTSSLSIGSDGGTELQDLCVSTSSGQVFCKSQTRR
jgi:hypothetical protein